MYIKRRIIGKTSRVHYKFIRNIEEALIDSRETEIKRVCDPERTEDAIFRMEEEVERKQRQVVEEANRELERIAQEERQRIVDLKRVYDRLERHKVQAFVYSTLPTILSFFPMELVKLVDSYLISKVIVYKREISRDEDEWRSHTKTYLMVNNSLFHRIYKSISSNGIPLPGWDSDKAQLCFDHLCCFGVDDDWNKILEVGQAWLFGDNWEDSDDEQLTISKGMRSLKRLTVKVSPDHHDEYFHESEVMDRLWKLINQ